MKTGAMIAAVLLSVSAPGMAMADDDECKVPMTQWQPREAVEQLAKARGWTVRRIKVDDGCYEIKGQDEKGRAIEVTVDPGSLAVIKVEHDDADDDDDLPRGARPEPAPSGGEGPPGKRPLTGTTAPKADVK
jgi:hypothetical protein